VGREDKEKQEGHQVAGKHKPPPQPPCMHYHHTPTQCPPLQFHLACPKPSHSVSVLGFGPNPSPPHVSQARGHHHLIHITTPPLRTIPLRQFAWCTQNQATTARFWLFSPNPLSRLTSANAMHHHHHHHLISTTTPPPSAALYPHFRQHARNRAPVARFWVLSP
jgi:hypothetical protein